MTKKRRQGLLPRSASGHLIGLRHTASFGSQVARSSGQLILDRSFTHLLGLRSRNGRWKLTRSSRRAQPTLTHGMALLWEGGFRSSFLTPQRALRRSHNCLDARAGRSQLPSRARAGRSQLPSRARATGLTTRAIAPGGVCALSLSKRRPVPFDRLRAHQQWLWPHGTACSSFRLSCSVAVWRCGR